MKRVAMRWHVDDAVVGRHDQTRATGHPLVEGGDLGVELFEDAEPAIGMPAVRVSRLVELGHVEVDQRGLGSTQHPSASANRSAMVAPARYSAPRRTAWVNPESA